jgi:hypothetical protein
MTPTGARGSNAAGARFLDFSTMGPQAGGIDVWKERCDGSYA